MRLESINNMASAEFRKVNTSSSKKKADALEKNERVSRSDSANLSSNTARANSAEASARMISARINAEPDVREEKVAEVRSRIESGYYNSSKFADTLADKLIEDFGF
ncbi:MAG: flagellar biosynthesis anti-sigma factor FlgM [Fibrobacterota bacterium]